MRSVARHPLRAIGFAAVGLFAMYTLLAGTPAEAQTVKRGGRLVIAQDEGPDRIDPHGTVMSFQHRIIVNGPYEALLGLDKDLTIGPSLATAWKEENPTSYTFTLREGVKFHDGSTMTMDDVLFTFQRIMDSNRPSDARTKMRMVKSVARVDDRTVRIELKSPSAPFLRYMASPEVTGIVSRKFTEAAKNDLTRTANGTGAFRITNFTPGVNVTFEKFADYWDAGKPYLDRIELRIIPDDSTRIAALRTGEIDMTFFRPDKRPLLNALRNVTIGESIHNSTQMLPFNCERAPMSDLRVRQAFALSIDRNVIMNTVFPGRVARPGMAVAPADKKYGYQGDGTDLPYWKGDIPRARKLLADAGFPNGLKMTIQYIGTPAFAVDSRISELLREQVARSGIDLQLVPIEYSASARNSIAGNYEIMSNGRGMDADPEGAFFDALGSAVRTKCKDPKFDAMVDAANAELDVGKRATMLTNAQKYILENVYFIYMFSAPFRVEVWKNDVKGYEPMPTVRRTSLRQVWLDR
ncbi:MAG: hypothetical protein FJY55_08890 [Betaproteobacteria bacterium]|nr:hypothetical protein [Betaproteobacteria bacterium]